MDLGLAAHMYASQWFLTLFTAKFPLFVVYHILDLFLCEVISGTTWFFGIIFIIIDEFFIIFIIDDFLIIDFFCFT